MILDPKDLKLMKIQKEKIEENKNIKINSFLNIIYNNSNIKNNLNNINYKKIIQQEYKLNHRIKD